MTALSELLGQHRPEGLTQRELARKAERDGLGIKRATISAYLRGDHGAPDEPTLADLAALFSVPIEDLRQAAGLPAGGGPYLPPVEAARLDQRERDALDHLIRAIVVSKGVKPDVARRTAPIGELDKRRRSRNDVVLRKGVRAARHDDEERPEDRYET